ncbi:MAG: stage III sporulation protein AF [Clostridia bacterium]|nr:stage III sporulation protein AF [Clostridia bacterium]
MDAFSSYILSIVGVILLGVLINLILPEGSMSKYIQNIFALIVVFVIVSPVSTLVNYNFDVGSIIETSQVEIDQNFVYLVNSQTVNQLEFSIENSLEQEGYLGVSVTISANITTSPLKVEKVTLDLLNLVINREVQHINKYSKMKEVVLEEVNIEEGKIVFYE